MNPKIIALPTTYFVGTSIEMSFANNRTRELWLTFMPRKKDILNPLTQDLFSIEVYPGLDFFKAFNPQLNFTRWTAVEVNDLNNIPEGLEGLSVPKGRYAVFTYKGKPSEVQSFYQYVLGKWIPESEYQLDDRPHFARMGEKYKGEDAGSEEELWFPVV